MTYSSGPVISDNFPDGEAYRDPLSKAPPEIVVEQLSRKNPTALSAMFEQLGITEEEFEAKVGERIKRETEELEKSLSDGKKE